MKIKILSWNIWVNGYFDKIADFLKSSDADIIALQEVQADDPARDVISFLTGLGYNHAFAPVQKIWGGKVWNDGPAVFSKFPVIGSENFILSVTEGRAALRVDIQVGNRPLHVFSTHLKHTHQQESEVQKEQVDNLIKLVPANNSVVTGDFNAVPESAVIKEMCGVLRATDPVFAPTWSNYPEGCTVCNPQGMHICLDYIFITDDIKADSFKVENANGSDHLPISVIIEV